MARRPKDIFSYADALFEMVEGVATRGESYSIEVESVQKARKLRGKFYAFREGLAAAVQSASVPGSTHHSMLTQLENTRQYARLTVCYFDEKAEGPILVQYLNKNDTPDAKLYAKALRSSGGVTITEGEPTNEELQARIEAKLSGGAGPEVPPEEEKEVLKDNKYY